MERRSTEMATPGAIFRAGFLIGLAVGAAVFLIMGAIIG